MAKVTLRVDFEKAGAIGPGKIRLLELVRDTGSISSAGRAMDMSYRRAWLLVDALNKAFRNPVVMTKLGGKAGGGAMLTPFGEDLIKSYRDMERAAHAALRPQLDMLEAAVNPVQAGPPTRSIAASVRRRRHG
jgi:molybdate transport system regulatory protein